MSRHARWLLITAFLATAGFALGVYEGIRARPDAIHWITLASNLLLALTGWLGWRSARQPPVVGRRSFFWRERLPPGRP